jgi:serine/threonine protein kinase
MALTPPSRTDLYASFPQHHTRKETIGSGSQAVVDLFSHNETNHLVAVKSLKPQTRVPTIRGLPNEFAILENLPEHKSIITCYSFHAGQGHEGADCLLFEYLPQGDMFTVRGLKIEKGGMGDDVWSEAWMWSVYSQLVSALAFLHEGIDAPVTEATAASWKPVVHRDIKLENVFVKSLGLKPDWSDIQIKLGDFGLAAEIPDEEDESEEKGWSRALPRDMGTPNYWPAEMTWENRTYRPKADVWAVGAVMHELAHTFPPIVDPYVTAVSYLTSPSDEAPLPEEWANMDKNNRWWYWIITTPRRPLPFNVNWRQQVADERRRRPCPQYSDGLNGALMLALKVDEKERYGAGKLKRAVEEAVAEWEFNELMKETEKLILEEKERASESEEEDEIKSEKGCPLD